MSAGLEENFDFSQRVLSLLEGGVSRRDFIRKNLGKVFSCSDLEALMGSRATICKMRRSGEIIRPFRGYYCLGEMDKFDAALLVLAKYGGGRGVVCGDSAAYLRGLVGEKPKELEVQIKSGESAFFRHFIKCRRRSSPCPGERVNWGEGAVVVETRESLAGKTVNLAPVA